MPPTETDTGRRFAGPALTEWIITRDRTCRAPGCLRPARTADIDHTIRHADGGLTTHTNLGALCRHHHVLKDATGHVTVSQPSPGIFVWRLPSGRTYEVHPDPD